MEAIVTKVLAMVQEILAYVQEPDAANIIEIIKNALSDLLGGIGL